jgi:DHA2 family multidrug resistance protein
MLDFVITRQATVLSFEKMFLLAGIVFLLVLPLLAFLKTGPKTGEKTEKVDVHVDI